MQSFEYTVIPAPTRGEKAKGLKTPADRYAHALTAEINLMAAKGWEYLRAETLPSEERSGLAGRATVYHNLLVFRRPTANKQTQATAPAAEAQAPIPAPTPSPAPAPDEPAPEALPQSDAPKAD